MVNIFRRHKTTGLSTSYGGGLTRDNAKGPGTALYVDTENLQGSAQTLIENIVEDWPAGTPPPTRLNLYVQADRVTLWDIWATGRFPQLAVMARGIQHFSNRQSKNSADIAIAIDAIADYVNGVAQYVAVMSDDSDFIPLYGKLKELSDETVPFLWLVTNRDKTRSTTIRDYFPNDHIHVVQMRKYSQVTSSRDARPNVAPRPRPAVRSAPPAADDGKSSADRMAEVADLIIEQIPAGSFRSTECQRVIKSRWPGDPMARMSSVRFGTEFANKIWPILDERGVELLSTKPRKYGLTQEVKDAHRNGASRT
ncbi:MAG: NYN domain-containing protein [Dehalococcoidia bacterium]|nr:NYN domain-containing protein [Dehalococcoidia bacterium]